MFHKRSEMRVKTVPRHRIIQCDTGIESGDERLDGNFENPDDSRSIGDEKTDLKYTTGALDMSDKCKAHNFRKFEHPENSAVNDDGKTEILNYTAEALDMSDKCKVEPVHKNIYNRCAKAGPSSCGYPEFSSKEVTRTMCSDNNNNTLCLDANFNCCSVSSPSSDKYSNSSCEDVAHSKSDDNDHTMKALNLSKKDSQKDVEEESPNSHAESDEKLKNTILYKIMTDPMFLENIQKNKQQKKFPCQFCKHDFVSSDELAKHMDVKKDESNQVVCCACKKTFAQKRYLRYHQRCHSERTKFTCDICTKKYTRLDNLTRHNTFHINPDKFSCMHCEKTFARKDLLNKHIKCHDNKYRFFCEMCEKYFKGPLTLDNHKKIFHSV